MLATVDPESYWETQRLFEEQYSADDDVVERAMNFVDRVTGSSNRSASDESTVVPSLDSCCAVCGIEVPLLFLLPCAHTICPECVAPDIKQCGVATCRFNLLAHVPKVVTEDVMAGVNYRRSSDNVSSSRNESGKRARGQLFWSSKRGKFQRVVKIKNETVHGLDAFANLQPGVMLEWKERKREDEMRLIAKFCAREPSRCREQASRRLSSTGVPSAPSPSESLPSGSSAASSSGVSSPPRSSMVSSHLAVDLECSEDLSLDDLLEDQTKAKTIVNLLRDIEKEYQAKQNSCEPKVSLNIHWFLSPSFLFLPLVMLLVTNPLGYCIFRISEASELGW